MKSSVQTHFKAPTNKGEMFIIINRSDARWGIMIFHFTHTHKMKHLFSFISVFCQDCICYFVLIMSSGMINMGIKTALRQLY